MPPVKNLYKTLQVDPSADPEVIAAAYKRLAFKYHPDRNGSPDAAQRMKEINVAYDVLSDPSKRAQHDRELAISSPWSDVKYEKARGQRTREEAEAGLRRAKEEQQRREDANSRARDSSCPVCGAANPANAMNCKQCRINFAFARENPAEVRRLKAERGNQSNS